MTDQIKAFCTKELLSDSGRYRIPMYQRNYAWGEGEITQLIQDIIDYQLANPEKTYHIGTLIVHRLEQSKDLSYETVDGQQRLTTLSLMAICIKHSVGDHNYDMSWYKALHLDFENRSNSTKTFISLLDNGSITGLTDDVNAGIYKGYRLIKKILPQKLKEHKCPYDTFCEYLFNKVQIMRVKLPSDTNLNHYFEIMNTRGEQLEKHEILKAKLMSALHDDESGRRCLAAVWDACSDMDKYIQMGFEPAMRRLIFDEKHWRDISIKNTEALFALYSKMEETEKKELSQNIDSIINADNRSALHKNSYEETPERFHSVINFQNFLLHVLSVYLGKSIALDDKRLIDQFENNLLNTADKVSGVKAFVFTLLKCRYLFDHFIIKREYLGESDRWSLKQLKAGETRKSKNKKSVNYVNSFGENTHRQILMLLSAFHTATPTMVYKHWLNAALIYLSKLDEIDDMKYLEYLEGVAKAFVFDRFLESDDPLDYADIIFKNEGRYLAGISGVDQEIWSENLKYGAIKNNFVFNFLDYLLWIERKDSDTKIQAFEFTFRSSVEHYAPQTPVDGDKPLPNNALHSFGNLCLISHSKNSRLSNHTIEAKKDYYKNNRPDSIKQHLMMKKKNWDESAIDKHYKEMENVLFSAISPLH